jgi:hypothetical protein
MDRNNPTDDKTATDLIQNCLSVGVLSSVGEKIIHRFKLISKINLINNPNNNRPNGRIGIIHHLSGGIAFIND